MNIRSNLSLLAVVWMSAALGGCAASASDDAASEPSQRSQQGEAEGAVETVHQGITSTASYNGACGSGYTVIDSRPLSGATVFLTYNGSTGDNCVLTVRDSSGTAQLMNACIKLSTSSTWNCDQGDYTTYAGPRYVHAPGQCVDWFGYFNGSNVTVLNSHCG